MYKLYYRQLICFVCLLFFAMPVFAEGIILEAGGTDYTAHANCMGAWYMNNNGGNETDRSGEGETLTHSSAPPTSATVPSGYSGTSRDLESSDPDYFEHSDGGSTDISGADQSISFGAWVRPESTTSDMAIMGKGPNTGSDRQYYLRYNSTSNYVVCGLSSDGSTTTAALSATDLSDGTWTHIMCVYNDTDIRIYFNGSLDSNGSDNPKTYSSGIYNGTDDFRVGGFGGSQYFDGLIDEAIVFNTALSAAEVAEIDADGISGNNGGND
jgi:hypothetical protein